MRRQNFIKKKYDKLLIKEYNNKQLVDKFFIKKQKRLNIYKKFICIILKDGKKTKAINFFFKTLFFLKLKYKKSSGEIIEKALINLMPYFFVKKYYVAGKIKYIPFILKEEMSINKAIKWLIKASRLNKKKDLFFKNLTYEIFNASQNKGEAIKLKNQLYFLCYEYRTYIGFGKRKKKKLNKKRKK